MMDGLIQFIKFCIVGLSNTLITYGIYYILIFCRISYIVSNTIGFILGMLNAFYWNSRFVFKGSRFQSSVLAFIKMLGVYSVTGIFLSNFLLFVLIEKMSFSKYTAPFFVFVVTIPLNFLLNKFWAFKTTEEGRLEK